MHLGVELWVAFSLLVTLKHLDLKDLGCVPFQLKDAGPRTWLGYLWESSAEGSLYMSALTDVAEEVLIALKWKFWSTKICQTRAVLESSTQLY